LPATNAVRTASWLSAYPKKKLNEILDTHPENFINPPATVEWFIKPYKKGEIAVIRIVGDGVVRECRLNHKHYIRDGASTNPISDQEARRRNQETDSIRKHDEKLEEHELRLARLELYVDGARSEVAEHAKRGNIEEAKKAIRDDKDLSIVKMAEARKAVETENFAEAEQLYKKAVELARRADKPDIEAVALAELAALVYAPQHQMDATEVHIRDSLNVVRKNELKLPEPFFHSASIHYYKEEYDRAIEDITKAIELDPEHVSWLCNRALAKYEKKDYNGAIADYSEAIRLRPRYAAGWYSLGYVRGKKQDYDGAIADYTRAIELRPDYAEAFNNRGQAKMYKGDYEGAVADHTEAIRLKPNDAKAYRNRGYAMAKEGNYHGAIADWSEAIRLDPDNATAFYNRGLANLEIGNYESTISDCSTAIALKPNYAMAFINRGNAKYKRGDYDGAISDHSEAIGLDPSMAIAFNNRGAAQFEKGDYDGAIADYTEAIRLDPNSAGSFSNRGNTKVAKGDYEGAIADCSSAIALNPNDSIAFYNRALANLALGRHGETLKDAEEAIRLDFKMAPSAMYVKIAVLFALKKYSMAESVLEKNKERLPKEVHEKLRDGMACWRVIEEDMEGVIERFREDKRIKGALIYGSAARLWGTPDRLLSPEVHDVDMIVIVDGFEDRDDAILTVARLRGKTRIPIDTSVYDVQMWKRIKEKDLFTKQEVLPKMKVLYGKV
jgi:tetratricopeptide (TPR) repeat protein